MRSVAFVSRERDEDLALQLPEATHGGARLDRRPLLEADDGLFERGGHREQPRSPFLVINRKSASMLGLVVPTALLLQADQVIQ